MTVRVGVIGTGSIAELGHLPHYQNHPDVELVAVADTNLVRAQKAAEKYSAATAYGDAAEMLSTEKLDAVSVCTPNSSHINLALMAVERGIDVLVEKPMATDKDEALQLAEAIHKSRRICMVGMTHRFRNEAQVLKRFVESGDLGEIYYAKAKILRRRGTPSGWFTSLSQSGGGPLMDIGVHALDLAWWIVGLPKPKSVSGQLVRGIGRDQTEMISRWQSADAFNQDNSIFDVEDFTSAFIRFENGLVIQLEASWALNGPQDDALKVDVFGSRGGLSLDPLRFYSEQNHIVTEAELSVDKNDPYVNEINEFISAVQTRRQPLITVDQGVTVVDMLTAITRSSELQSEVVLGK
jgi:predicted dehydrogenase